MTKKLGHKYTILYIDSNNIPIEIRLKEMGVYE